MNKFPEYNDSYTSSTQYIDDVNKYVNNLQRAKYDIMLKFLNKWMKGIVKLWKLTDFKCISQFSLPKDKHSKDILEKYADYVSKKLEVNYKFDETKIQEHYARLKKNKKTKTDDTLKKNTICNAAHDNKYIFRSEMINLLRSLLKKINYVLYSRRTEKCIVWEIRKCDPEDIAKNAPYSDSFMDVYATLADQDKSMTDYINKRFKNGRRKQTESSEDTDNSNSKASESDSDSYS
jgi:hypothetical protein